MSEPSDAPPPAAEIFDEPVGYPLPLLMFTIYFLYSFAYYPVFWAYKNLANLRLPGPNRWGSAVYALFLPLSFEQLLRGVEEAAAGRGKPVKLHRFVLAGLYLLMLVAAKADRQIDPEGIWGRLGLFSSLFVLLFAQHKINQVNRALGLNVKTLRPYTRAQKFLLAALSVVALPFLYAYFTMPGTP